MKFIAVAFLLAVASLVCFGQDDFESKLLRTNWQIQIRPRIEPRVTNLASGRAEISHESLAIISDLDLNVAPESARSIGNLPYALAGVGVSVDGRSAKLRYVGQRTIVFVAPRMPPRKMKKLVTVRVVAPDSEVSIEVAFAPASPGLFCDTGTPRLECLPQAIYHMEGNAPFLVQESTLLPLSRLDRDARVQVMGTGMKGVPREEVEVRLCGTPLQVIRAGSYLNIEGMDAVTFVLPAALPDACPMTHQPVVVKMRGKESNHVWLNLQVK